MKLSVRANQLKGFTLLELLVVISIIGLLSVALLVAIGSARKKSNDARRKIDVDQIINALNLYYDKHSNFIESASGCGYGGNGMGFFSYEGGTYPKSIAQCLVDEGFLPYPIVDPSGGKNSGRYYMKYNCTLQGKRTAMIFANMETLPQSSTATDDSCCSTCDSGYGMNYFKIIR